MTSAIALLLILLGGYAMAIVGHASACRMAARRELDPEFSVPVEWLIVAALLGGLVLLLAGWWLA